VPRNQIDPRYVDAPYYIAPDGKVGQEAFAVIREAMRAKDMVGIGRVVLSSRERPIVVEPFGKGVRAFTLNYPYDVRSEAAYFESISDAAVPRELLELAEAIVDSKASDFNPEKFVDRYENAVVEMLRAKQAGKPAPKAKVQEPSGNVVNLMDTLRASIKATKSAVVGRPVDLNPNHNAGGDAAEAAAAPRKATKTKTAPTTAARKKKSA
jgi:DNA end-binding protein Ku